MYRVSRDIIQGVIRTNTSNNEYILTYRNTSRVSKLTAEPRRGPVHVRVRSDPARTDVDTVPPTSI